MQKLILNREVLNRPSCAMVKTKGIDDDAAVDSRNVLPESARRRSRPVTRYVISPTSPENPKSTPSKSSPAQTGPSSGASAKRSAASVRGAALQQPRTAKKQLFPRKKSRAIESDSEDEEEESERAKDFAVEESSDEYAPHEDANDSDSSSSAISVERDDENDQKSSSDDEDEDEENRDPVGEGMSLRLPKRRKWGGYKVPNRKMSDVFSRKKVKGSGETLDGLEIKHLENDTIVKAVMGSCIRETHPSVCDRLMEEYRIQFYHWLSLLAKGWHLMLYGVGSKRQLMDKFTKEFLGPDRTYLTFNGYLPNANVKALMSSIIEKLLEEDMPSTISAQLDVIESVFHSDDDKIGSRLTDDDDLYIIIYGLEHTVSSSSKQKDLFRRVLCALAQMSRIHLIAVADHVNVDSLFDFSELSRLKFVRMKVTTYEPYLTETYWLGSSGKLGLGSKLSLRIGDRGAVAISALHHLFSSLTKNAKEIFFVMARNQLEKSAETEGMTFNDLYQACRDDLLVNSDVGLRGQLREFVDHKVLTFGKRKTDGAETVKIPLETSVISQFMEEQGDE